MKKTTSTTTKVGASRQSWKPINYSCPLDLYEWLTSLEGTMKKSQVITLALTELKAKWNR